MNEICCSFLTLIVISENVISQGENNIWYFSDGAGIDFNQSPPSPLSNGSIKRNVEGVVTVSDSKGSLLFYSDGTTVWNKNHEQMPNGYDLRGFRSSTQSALVVPIVNTDRYFIFTVTSPEGRIGNTLDRPFSEFNYSIINMSLDSGLGDVEQLSKNKILLDRNLTEKLVAIRGECGTVWVIAHEADSNNFKVVRTIEDRVSQIITSSIGQPHVRIGNQDQYQGQLKSSPNGEYIAHVVPTGIIEIFKFDHLCGLISDPISIEPLDPLPQLYGLSFSPDSEKLYIGMSDKPKANTPTSSYIYQYDISNYDSISINESREFITNKSATNKTVFDLALGPDDAIYIGQDNTSYIGRIENPNAEAADVIYNDEALHYPNNIRISGSGLQNHVLVPLAPSHISYKLLPNDTIICDSQDFSITLPDNPCYISWDDGSSSINRRIINSGTYHVTVSGDGCDVLTDSITVSLITSKGISDDIGNIILCQDSDTLVSVPSDAVDISWSIGSNASSYLFNKSGTYSVSYRQNGSIVIDSFEISIIRTPSISLALPFMECADSNILLNIEPLFDSVVWNTGLNSNALTVYESGDYTVTGYLGGCQASNTQTIELKEPIDFSIVSSSTTCESDSILLSIDRLFDDYLWNTGSVENEITVNKGEKYWIDIEIDGCGYSDTISIPASDPSCGESTSQISSMCESGENNNWYFAKEHHISFNSGEAVYKSEGSIPINTEGVSAVSTANGDLLFYSDGVTVFDALHNPMPNGSDLKGNGSTAQSVVIVPQSCMSNLYFIFTLTGGVDNDEGGLFYSIIDMTLREGLGDVTDKKNIFIEDFLAEKMVAIKGFSGIVWLLVKRRDIPEYISIKIDANGINQEFVTSDYDKPRGTLTTTHDIGKFNVSTDFTKVAESSWLADEIKIHDFDRSTGIITGTLNIANDLHNSNAICFSPDNSKLYTVENRNNPKSSLYQYDLSQFNRNQIQQSRFKIGELESVNTFYGLQRGPDDKIYGGGILNRHVSLISDPNVAGLACGFDATFIRLEPFSMRGASLQNLVVVPELSQNVERPFPLDTIVCIGDSIRLSSSLINASYLWQDGSTQDHLIIRQSGIYWVERCIGSCYFSRDSISVTFTDQSVLAIDENVSSCDDQSAILSSTLKAISYTWSTGASSSSIEVTSSGSYWLEATVGECILRDTIQVTIGDQDTLDIGDMILTCNTDPITLMSNIDGETYTWSTGEDTAIIEVTATGSYTLEVQSVEGCIYRDTIDIVFDELSVDLGADQEICIGDSTILSAPSPETLSSILWSDGSVDPDLIVRSADSYWLAIERGMCFASDTIMISYGVCDMIPDSMMMDTMMIDTMTGSPGFFVPDEPCQVYVPNAISADATRPLNRVFQIFSDCDLASVSISIYDRWGNLHHRTSDRFMSTDNMLLNPGVYVAKIAYRFVDMEEEQEVLQSVTVL